MNLIEVWAGMQVLKMIAEWALIGFIVLILLAGALVVLIDKKDS